MIVKLLRILLFPISLLYALVVSVRNILFDLGIISSTSFSIPVIVVGNLSVGGTGKTPQIEYLIRLLQHQYTIAVLSRGYKRKSKGFVLANKSISMEEIGDEPYQYFSKFSTIKVAVDADRVHGVHQLLQLKDKPEVVLLDDAFQHRKLKAGFNVMLTAYDDLFYKDFMLPTGNLRELWWGKNRASVIIVTKCPLDLDLKKQSAIIHKINPAPHQYVFFSAIVYASKIIGPKEILLDSITEEVLLITGIAKPAPLLTYLNSKGIQYVHLNYPDHYMFNEKDIQEIKNSANGKMILTTEKDYVRLQEKLNDLYYLPIETKIINNSEMFDKLVLDFINQ